MKKRGFGSWRWNGFGGKIKPKESAEEGASRELLEESGLVSQALEQVGLMNFYGVEEDKIFEVIVFSCVNYSGEPKETEEMRPRWFELSEIPFDRMWPDDRHWMPIFLKNRKFKGDFFFEGSDKLLKFSLKEVDTF